MQRDRHKRAPRMTDVFTLSNTAVQAGWIFFQSCRRESNGAEDWEVIQFSSSSLDDCCQWLCMTWGPLSQRKHLQAEDIRLEVIAISEKKFLQNLINFHVCIQLPTSKENSCITFAHSVFGTLQPNIFSLHSSPLLKENCKCQGDLQSYTSCSTSPCLCPLTTSILVAGPGTDNSRGMNQMKN